MISDHKYAFIHVEKTAGWSIRRAINRSKQIKYVSHGQQITDQLASQYTTVSVSRDPVERFTSWFRWKYRWHDTSNMHQLLQDHLENDLNCFLTYSYYFEHHQPDIFLSFNDIQNEWTRFLTTHNITDVEKKLPHEHCLTNIYIRLTKKQHNLVRNRLFQDINIIYGNNNSSTIYEGLK